MVNDENHSRLSNDQFSLMIPVCSPEFNETRSDDTANVAVGLANGDHQVGMNDSFVATSTHGAHAAVVGQSSSWQTARVS